MSAGNFFSGAFFGSGFYGAEADQGKVGGDDVPRRSPHRGWNKKEWQARVRAPDRALEATLRSIYAELTGEDATLALLARVDEIVRPVARRVQLERRDIPLVIDWAAIARSYDRSNALARLRQEERELRAMIEDEDEILMLTLQ